MKIGELARHTGVSVDTIRFYERRGVLPPPDRLPSGYRDYSLDMAERIRMAKFLQSLGFTLDEIVASLADIDAGAIDQPTGQARLTAMLERVEVRIADLEDVRRNIGTVIAECQAGRCRWECAVTRAALGS